MPEQEQADFSDMGETQLPDTIEETSTQDQHIAISYEDEESLKEGKPEGQPQETQKEETPEEKSFKYWQSQADKKDRELQELRNQQQQGTQQFENLQREIQQLRGELNPVPKEEPLVKPQKPNSDDPMDLIKWQSEMLDYQDKLFQRRDEQFTKTTQTFEQEMQRRQQEEKYAQEKAYHIGQLQRKGLSPEEANEAFVMYSKAQDDPDAYYKDLADYFRFKRGQHGSPKTNRATQQGEIPPLANVTSEVETQKTDEGKGFWDDMNQMQKRYY